MTINTKSTKAQLLGHIAAQDAQLVALGRKIEALRLDVSIAKIDAVATKSVATPGRSRSAYYAYINQCRREHRERGQRVCGYLTFADWSAA